MTHLGNLVRHGHRHIAARDLLLKLALGLDPRLIVGGHVVGWRLAGLGLVAKLVVGLHGIQMVKVGLVGLRRKQVLRCD